jgi:hypothetical protein
MYRAIGIVIPLVTALLLFGVLGGTEMIVFKTGIKLGTIFAIANLVVAFLIFKNHI